jgi:hypothetical protein
MSSSIPPIAPSDDPPITELGEESKKDSSVSEPTKKVGRHSHRKKGKWKQIKKNKRGMQSTLDGIVIKETRETRGPCESIVVQTFQKEGSPNPPINDENPLLELQRPR